MTMRFHVLNVGHGFCAYAAADNGNIMMFDCGHQTEPSFRPSEFLRQRRVSTIHRLFITNYDEDHISDLPGIRRGLHVQILHRNKSISVDQLRRLKLQGGPISAAMESLLDMMSSYTSPVTDEPPFPRISWESFHAQFGIDFDDTNNISLVTFLQCGNLNVLIPGDLERPGWLHHLRQPRFRELLGKVNVFVASHHGREGGYCREVFDYCRPAVIVFSDSPIVHGTQETANRYASHAQGTQFNGETRYVLSTRSDGDFWWDNL
jgi:beta-lactamase superfamily II metal-dependent hydrolase